MSAWDDLVASATALVGEAAESAKSVVNDGLSSVADLLSTASTDVENFKDRLFEDDSPTTNLWSDPWGDVENYPF